MLQHGGIGSISSLKGNNIYAKLLYPFRALFSIP